MAYAAICRTDLKKLRVQWILIGSVMLGSVHSANIQKFTGLSYDNPARMSQVKNKQIILGSSALLYNFTYSGTSALGSGSVSQQPRLVLPYFRFVDRVNEKFVFGLDITDPIASYIAYPTDSFINALIIANVVNSTNIAPNVSYSVNKELALGAGVDAMHAVFNWRTMPQANNVFINKSDGWNYGWHVGALYSMTEKTTLGATYYSPIKLNFKGPSTYRQIQTTWTTYINMPASLLLTIVQKITPKWSVSGVYTYSWWNIDSLYYNDTARGNLISSNWKYHNTNRLGISGQYTQDDKWTYRIGAGFEQSPIDSDTRTLSNPTVNSYALSIGGSYKITPEIAIDLTYARVFIIDALIKVPAPNTNGVITGYANALDAKLTWNF